MRACAHCEFQDFFALLYIDNSSAWQLGGFYHLELAQSTEADTFLDFNIIEDIVNNLLKRIRRRGESRLYVLSRPGRATQYSLVRTRQSTSNCTLDVMLMSSYTTREILGTVESMPCAAPGVKRI